MANQDTVYSVLTNKYGLSCAAACGIMGNMFYESSFNPAAVGDGGTSFGLCQWHNERGTAMKNYCAANGGTWSSNIEGQIGYLMKELSNGYSKTRNAVNNCSNDSNGCSQVAKTMMTDFERPADQSAAAQSKRANKALEFFSKYTGTPSTYDDSYNGYVSDNAVYADSIGLTVGDPNAGNMESAVSALSKSGDIYSAIISLKDGKEFSFYTNENFSENFPVSYSSPGNVLGRSVPVLGYDSTGARTLAISLDLFAGTPYRPGLDGSVSDPVGVLHSDLDLLKSFEYPDYSSAIVLPPPNVLLSIGNTIRIKGVLQGLSIEYDRPFDDKNRPMHAKVSFTITQVSDDPPDYSDIRSRSSKSY